MHFMVGEEEAAGEPHFIFPATKSGDLISQTRGLFYRSSSTVFNNCMAATSVWFGRLHQKLAVTGEVLLPVCLQRACPHMCLWHCICQVWCWIGKGLATLTWICSVCLWHFKFYLLSKAPNHCQILIKNQSEFLSKTCSLHAAFISSLNFTRSLKMQKFH